MKVSINGLRNTLLRNYNSLTYKLNRRIDKDGNIVDLSTSDIQREIDQIRSCLVTLAFTYIEGEEDFTIMSDDTHFETFNEQEENEQL